LISSPITVAVMKAATGRTRVMSGSSRAQVLATESTPVSGTSGHPETALFRRGGVNLRLCLCGVPVYASA
jgi:hypothetical protein